MFVILTYDAESERLSKIRKTCKKYLHPVQRSVFEGHLTEKNLRLLKEDVARVIDPEKDHVVLYLLSYGDKFQKLEIGKRRQAAAPDFRRIAVSSDLELDSTAEPV